MKAFKKKYPKISKALHYTGNAIQIASKAYSMAKVVAAIVNAEKKYCDVGSNISPDTTAQIYHLSPIAQGTDEDERGGDTVSLKSLMLRLHVAFDASVIGEAIRIIVFRDMDNNGGTAPTAAELLDSNTGVMGRRNQDTPKRFKVLFDKTHTCNISKPVVHYVLYKKFPMGKDRKGNPTRAPHLEFSGALGTDTTRGHIYLAILGNIATASTTSDVAFNSRIRYYDN